MGLGKPSMRVDVRVVRVVWITDAKIQKKYQFAKYQAFITLKIMLIFHMQYV